MALRLPQLPLLALVFLFSVLNSCSCIMEAARLRSLAVESEWQLAAATWYGSPNGAGSDGGACGYGKAVEQPPFSRMVSAGGPSLFRAGQGCGTCYEVKCSDNSACSRKLATVVITDECPGCVSEFPHFDLSGAAFGAMAVPGEEDRLRGAGKLHVEYRRTPCKYSGVNVAFHVDGGSNPYYFAASVEFVNGDGELAGVELREKSSPDKWRPMQRSWGAVWRLSSASPLRPPFSLRLMSGKSRSIVARDVIPAEWTPGATYRSTVNF